MSPVAASAAPRPGTARVEHTLFAQPWSDPNGAPYAALTSSPLEGATTLRYAHLDDLAVRGLLAPGVAEPPADTLAIVLEEGRTLRAQRTAVERDLFGNVTWVGVPDEDRLGLVVLTWNEGRFYAELQTRAEQWTVATWGADVVEVKRVERGRVRDFHAGDPETAVARMSGTDPVDDDTDAALDSDLDTDTESDPPPCQPNTPCPPAPGTELPPAWPDLPPGPEVNAPAGAMCGTEADDSKIEILVYMTSELASLPDLSSATDRWARVATRTAWANASLRNSGIDGSFRVVGVEVLPASFDGLPSGSVLTCVRDDNSTNCTAPPNVDPPLADRQALWTNRDAYGADLIHVFTLGATGNVTNGFLFNIEGSGCVTGRRARPVSVTGWSALSTSFVHELGHALGGHHGRWQDQGGDFGDSHAYMAPDCSFTTLMGAAGPGEPLSQPADPTYLQDWANYYWREARCRNLPDDGDPDTDLEWRDANDIPYFSSPCAEAGYAGVSPSSPSGGVFVPAGDEDNENVRIMKIAWPYVARYRTSLTPDWRTRLARLTGPAEGAFIVPPVSQTFTWTDEDPTEVNQYMVEIGFFPEFDNIRGTNISFSDLTTGTSVAIPDRDPSVSESVALNVRMWTLLPNALATGASVWDFRSYRIGWQGTMRDCEAFKPELGEDFPFAAGLVPADFFVRTCDIFGRDVCTASSGSPSIISCDLDQGGTTDAITGTPWITAVTPTLGEATADFVAWGTAEEGLPFCCVYQHPTGTGPVEINLYGTQLGDQIRLQTCSGETLRFQAYSADVEVSGRDGDDVIVGSFDREPYVETLRGNGGDDIVLGSDGDHILYGGAGRDLLHGGQGDDVLYGAAAVDYLQGGPGVDALYGGDAGDLLCDAAEPDWLQGAGGDDGLYWEFMGAYPYATGDPGLGVDICSELSPLPGWITGCESYLNFGDDLWKDNCLDHFDYIAFPAILEAP